MIPENQNINFSQLQSLGELAPSKTIISHPTLESIKETFRSNVIIDLEKKVKELEGR